jgi:hypothetical protein
MLNNQQLIAALRLVTALKGGELSLGTVATIQVESDTGFMQRLNVEFAKLMSQPAFQKKVIKDAREYSQDMSEEEVLERAFGEIYPKWMEDLERRGKFTKGKLQVYRGISVKTPQDIDYKNIGVYWTWDKAKAANYSDSNTATPVTIVTGLVGVEDIDLKETLSKLVWPGYEFEESEREIHTKPQRVEITASISWYQPNQGELAKEFSEEPSLVSYAENISGIRSEGPLKKAFQEIMSLAKVQRFSPDETFKIKDIPAGKGSSLDDVGLIVKRYGGPKDWDRIVDRVKGGKAMPMPIVEKKENGEYQALGGRTRLSAAAILGVPVQVLVLDTQAIKPVFFDSKLKSLLSIFMLFPEGSKEYGEAYVRFLMKDWQEPSAPTNLSDDVDGIQEQAKEIAEELRQWSY